MRDRHDAQITKFINRYKKEVVEFCQALVKTPSVNGINREEEIAHLIQRRAERLGLPSKPIVLNKARPNVFVGEGFDTKEGLLFIAHLDTVAASNENAWTYNPFEAEIERGKLFGRGSCDCKAGIALSLYTLKILKELGELKRAKFLGVVDEESGADSKIGARYVLSQGLKARAAIYTYPSTDTIAIGHRGLVRLWVEAKGVEAHTGSKSWQDKTRGVNAIEGLVEF